MVKNKLHKLTQTHITHSVLIGAPLALTLLFAFGFVLIRPAESANQRPAAASRPAGPAAHKAPGVKVTSLTPAPLAPTKLPALTPAPTNSSGSDTRGSSGGPPASITSPQAASDTPTNSSGVQSAVPNTSASSPSQPLSTTSSSPRSLIGGLLRVL